MIDIDETIRRLYPNPYEEQSEEEYRYACYVEGGKRLMKNGERRMKNLREK